MRVPVLPGSDCDGGGGEEDGESECTEPDPPPGADCQPEEPCDGPDPPIYCEGIDVDATKRCSNDPLKDMEIRATCNGIEGGRFGGRDGDHNGIDLLADVGTDLYAAAGGTVIQTGDRGDQGWGKFVHVESNLEVDGEAVQIVYAHLSDVQVSAGESVIAGAKIGETGTSGNACPNSCSCGPAHVHIEMKPVGDNQTYNEAGFVNPEDFLGTEFSEGGDPISDSCE